MSHLLGTKSSSKNGNKTTKISIKRKEVDEKQPSSLRKSENLLTETTSETYKKAFKKKTIQRAIKRKEFNRLHVTGVTRKTTTQEMPLETGYTLFVNIVCK